jgi:hypothetical protein
MMDSRSEISGMTKESGSRGLEMKFRASAKTPGLLFRGPCGSTDVDEPRFCGVELTEVGTPATAYGLMHRDVISYPS